MANKKPILTIGIPTYNRGRFLSSSLGSICREFGNNEDVEILVSNNGSTDNTEEIILDFKKRYNNVVYYKQDENVGFDRNLKTILDLAKGEFIKGHGDDDYIIDGKLSPIIQEIQKASDFDLFFINTYQHEFSVISKGIDNYIKGTRNSNGITFISTIIFRKSAYNNIIDKEKHVGSKIYQLYIQMEILKNNPNFYIFGGPFIAGGSGLAGMNSYEVGDVFIGSYFDILQEYLGLGLTEDVFKAEKEYMLNKVILPLADRVSRKSIEITIKNLDKIYTKYYADEPYYENGLNKIKAYMNF